MTTATDRIVGLNGFTAWKPPVRVATTANITLSGEQTIDGVETLAGDRVLVKDQTTASENGIYVAATGAWTRATDFDGARDVVTGTAVFVLNGSVNTGLSYYLSTSGTISVGSTSLSFSSFITSQLSFFNYLTRAALAAANVPAVVTQVRTAGYTTANDGGDALYVRVGSEPSHDGKVQSADGAWWEYVPGPEGVSIPALGGTTAASDIGPVFLQALAYLGTGGGKIHLPPGSYTWATEAAVTEALIKEDITFTGYGAKIECTHNGVALNLHSDWNASSPATARRWHIMGMEWHNSNATKTASTAIKARGMRKLVLQDISFGDNEASAQGFWKGVNISAKDTYIFRGCYWFANTFSIHIPAAATSSADKTIAVALSDCHFSVNGMTNAILVEDAIAKFSIDDASTINGACTAGQIKFVDSTLVQSEDIHIAAHQEQFDSNGAIVFAATNSSGFYGVRIESDFVSASNGWVGVILDKCLGVTIKSQFRDGGSSSGEIGIQVDGDSRDVEIWDGITKNMTSPFFQNVETEVDLTTLSGNRADVQLMPATIWLTDQAIDDGTTDLTATGLSTAAAVTVDMSAIGVSAIANSVLPPRAYTITGAANDSGSAAATSNVRALVKTSTGASAARNCVQVSLDGVVNDQVRQAIGVVIADSNGDIAFQRTASGAGTLDTDFRLIGIHR